MIELITPTMRLHTAWLDAHYEWGPGTHEDGFGLDASDEIDSPPGFKAWLTLLAQEADPARERHSTCRWIVEDDRVLGGIALRDGYNDVTMQLGHIGYGIRPSSRRRGVGTWALGQMLDVAAKSGMDRVLLVCETDNTASIKTIENTDGVLEAIRETEDGPPRRYWIDLDRRHPATSLTAP